MAIGSVVNFMNQHGLVKSAKDVNAGLAQLHQALISDERYNPSEFQNRLRKFRALIAAQ